MNIQSAVDRLNSQLPLKARQAQLSPALKKLHQAILLSLVTQGTPPTHEEMAEQMGEAQVASALQTLGAEDLVVLNAAGTDAVGAYPITTEATPHQLNIDTRTIYAMCALDAVSVAPMFASEVKIASHCHVSGDPIQIHMRGSDVIESNPEGVMIGIRWQMPSSVAAHSMCTEMVFLKDENTARQWQGDELESISLFSLADAIAFGMGFFMPLMDDGQ